MQPNLASANIQLPLSGSKSRATRSPISGFRWSKLVGVCVLVILPVIIYFPAIHGKFVLDDDVLITNNDLVSAPGGLARIWLGTDSPDYWPLTNTSFWLEWRLWGPRTLGYHASNIALHVISALLIWIALSRLSIPGAFWAALLFAVHPVNVESVAWIAQRKNLLAIVFFLSAIICFVESERGCVANESHDDKRGSSGGRSFMWYLISLVCFILAMLSKGSAAVLPVVLLLLMWWQRTVTRRNLVLLLPFFGIAVALALLNIWFQTHGSGQVFRTATLTQRALGAGAVVWFYLGKALLPVNLSFIYPQWRIDVRQFEWSLPLVMALFGGMILWTRRNSRFGQPLFIAATYFCVTLLPVLGFVDVGFMQYSLVADHYDHLGLIGISALAAAAWSNWICHANRPGRITAIAVAVAVVLTLGLESFRQSELYAGPIPLYKSALVHNPRCAMLYNNLGTAFNQEGQSEAAIRTLQQAIKLDPNFAEAENDLGIAFADAGRPADAMLHFKRALELKPAYPKANFNLGMVDAQVGRLDDAIEQYRLALESEPEYADAHNAMGIALASQGRLPEAISQLQRAVELRPITPKCTTILALRSSDLEICRERSCSSKKQFNSGPNS